MTRYYLQTSILLYYNLASTMTIVAILPLLFLPSIHSFIVPSSSFLPSRTRPFVTNIPPPPSSSSSSLQSSTSSTPTETHYDVITIGAGIGGLCCSALTSHTYNLTTLCLEAHDTPGGCAHAFTRRTSAGSFHFDSGPSLLSGMSPSKTTNPLRQVLEAVGEGDTIDWRTYDGWMVWDRAANNSSFKLTTGDDGRFEEAIESMAGGEARREFERFKNEVLKEGGLSEISAYLPPFALRGGVGAAVTLLGRYFDKILKIGPRGALLTGSFGEIMERYGVRNAFLRQWFDYLSFALSGLPAANTQAAPVLYTMSDLHRPNVMLDYPMGGMGTLSDALVAAMTKSNKGTLQLNSRVQSFILSERQGKAHCDGVVLDNGQKIFATRGVVCNAPLWNMAKILQNSLSSSSSSPTIQSAIQKVTTQAAQMNSTGSFMHLHLGIPSHSLPSDLECHHSVFIDFSTDVTAPQNLVIVSIPTVFDPSLAPEGYHIIHAYTAASENYTEWEEWEPPLYSSSPSSATARSYNRPSSSSSSSDNNNNTAAAAAAYRDLKSQKAQVLWDAIATIIPDVHDRITTDTGSIALVGTPLTHRRYISRERGTYGPAPRDGRSVWDLAGATTGIDGLYACGDTCFPGIGLPGVAASGTVAANTIVGVGEQWRVMNELKERGVLQ